MKTNSYRRKYYIDQFVVGDTIRIVPKIPIDKRVGERVSWVESMNNIVGKIGRVKRIVKEDECLVVDFSKSGLTSWWIHPEWLISCERIDRIKKNMDIVNNI